MIKRILIATASAAALLMCSAASAGPFILAGTDADDHGGVSAGVNQTGWLFMQRALENLGPAVTNGKKVVTIMGSTSTAGSASSSAFNLSSLVAASWTLQTISTSDFTDYFANAGAFTTTGVSASGILMLDSGNNVTGGVNGSAFVPFATTMNNFLGTGGGLLSQADGYQWLTALVPTLIIVGESSQGLGLTAAGNSAFPSLTNADLSSGPWHNSFSNTGAIQILTTSTTAGSTFGHAVIIGGAAGTFVDPGKVPEPGTLALVAVALGAAGMLRKKKTT